MTSINLSLLTALYCVCVYVCVCLGLTGYSSDDINKFLWPVRIGSGVFPNDMPGERDFLTNGKPCIFDRTHSMRAFLSQPCDTAAAAAAPSLFFPALPNPTLPYFLLYSTLFHRILSISICTINAACYFFIASSLSAGNFDVGPGGAPALLNCVAYKLCYYKFGQMETGIALSLEEDSLLCNCPLRPVDPNSLCNHSIFLPVIKHIFLLFRLPIEYHKPPGYDRARGKEVRNVHDNITASWSTPSPQITLPPSPSSLHTLPPYTTLLFFVFTLTRIHVFMHVCVRVCV